MCQRLEVFYKKKKILKISWLVLFCFFFKEEKREKGEKWWLIHDRQTSFHIQKQKHANKLTVKLTANDEKAFFFTRTPQPSSSRRQQFEHRNYCLIAVLILIGGGVFDLHFDMKFSQRTINSRFNFVRSLFKSIPKYSLMTIKLPCYVCERFFVLNFCGFNDFREYLGIYFHSLADLSINILWLYLIPPMTSLKSKNHEKWYKKVTREGRDGAITTGYSQ